MPAGCLKARVGEEKGLAAMMGDWSDMGSYGLGHWAVFAITVAIILYPIGRILGRIGFSPFWSVLALVPIGNLIALWFLAFIAWPEKGRSTIG